MMHASSPSTPLLKQIAQASLSKERMEFQSHDCAASVELESHLTLADSLPTAAPFLSHTHLPLSGLPAPLYM